VFDPEYINPVCDDRLYAVIVNVYLTVCVFVCCYGQK